MAASFWLVGWLVDWPVADFGWLVAVDSCSGGDD